MMIITTITEAIGSTPFFKFTAKDYPMPQHSAIYAKLEYLNP
ncbi:cysteine synthase, partial [Staphylococcus warneri]